MVRPFLTSSVEYLPFPTNRKHQCHVKRDLVLTPLSAGIIISNITKIGQNSIKLICQTPLIFGIPDYCNANIAPMSVSQICAQVWFSKFENSPLCQSLTVDLYAWFSLRFQYL